MVSGTDLISNVVTLNGPVPPVTPATVTSAPLPPTWPALSGMLCGALVVTVVVVPSPVIAEMVGFASTMPPPPR